MKFHGVFIILILLLLVNGRVFFPKNGKRDPLVAVSPFSVLLSLLLLFSWRLNLYTATTLVLSVLVLLTNFHALFRYSGRLYVDNYSNLMKFWAIITTLITTAAIIVMVKYAPVMESPKKKHAVESTWSCVGTIRNGFEPASNTDRINAIFTEYSLFPNISNRDYVVLFLPDRRANVEAYGPYLEELAEAGCTVYTADFYTNDCHYMSQSLDNRMLRKFFLNMDYIKDKQKFASQREFFTFNQTLEGEALIKQASKRYGEQCKFFLLTDSMGATAAEDLYKKYPDLLTGIYSIENLQEYTTPGFGFVGYTDPLMARILGQKQKGDRPQIQTAAEKTAKIVKPTWGIKVQ